METVPCNLCGSNQWRVVFRKPDEHFPTGEVFQAVRCCRCGLGFLNPRPTTDEIGKYYPPIYYREFVDNRLVHERRYRIEASYLAPLEQPNRSRNLLDVGCANGDFPRYMRGRGWEVEGVEVSETSEPITDFSVYRTEFPEIPVDAPMYDAVTAWAVLEHVHNPGAYFEKVARVLKANGTFVFLVHNFDSVTSRALFAEDVPRHLYFFTEPTVRRYLRRAGLELERADYTKDIVPMPPAGWLHYVVAQVFRRELKWPIQQSYSEFLRATRRRRSVLSAAAFAARSPLSIVDRALLPLVEQLQLLLRTYDTVTYVARKVV